jgi:hypothetical protein
VKSSDFDNPYGASFQAYVGDVLAATCSAPQFKIFGEESYQLASRLMHGADWILSDGSAHLFVECKAKRLRVNSKTRSDKVALEQDLIVLATAIVQHYRNIIDALAGHTKWQPDGLPIYPIILTLEDWLVLGPRVGELLDSHVQRILVKQGLPENLTEKMPYTIASSFDFEIASQIIAQVGILPVMKKKTEPQARGWILSPFLQGHFGAEMRNVNWQLFRSEWDKLVPDGAHW